MKQLIIICKSGLFLFFLVLGSLQALSSKINTADKSSAYYSKFCPLLQKALKKAQFDYECVPTDGTINNIKRVGEDARQIGYAQLDLFAQENTMLGGKKLYHTLRDDIAKVCLFMVSKHRGLNTYGQVVAHAEKLRFIMPPKDSNHVGTFQYLQQIDPKGLGLATHVKYVNSVDTAVSEVLSSDDPFAITLFVQFPDPNGYRFKRIAKAGGTFIPVIDRSILRQDISGVKVYYAESTKIANPKWYKKGASVVTSCTPIVLFTGASKLIKHPTNHKDHVDLIKTVEALPITQLQPEKGLLSNFWLETKTLSAKNIEALLEASERARKAAKPVITNAKNLGKKVLQKSKPLLNRVKELGTKALKKAEEWTGETEEKE